MVSDGMRWDGIGWDGMGLDGMRGIRTGWGGLDRMGCDWMAYNWVPSAGGKHHPPASPGSDCSQLVAVVLVLGCY